MVGKNIFFVVFILFFISCDKNYTIIEMVEQRKGLLTKLNYRINTTEGSVELNLRKRQYLDLHGQILQIGSSNYEFRSYKDFNNIFESCYYNEYEKKIIVYFYYYKYGIDEIENLNTILSVEPFEKFNGFYTKYFIYNDVKYQTVSMNPEIEIGEYAEEFDYKKIKELKIAQYKKIGIYGEEERRIDKESIENGIYQFNLNYIFPEEFNTMYIKYTLR